jgi:hypothetical protein
VDWRDSLASFPRYGTGVPLAAAAEALTTPLRLAQLGCDRPDPS